MKKGILLVPYLKGYGGTETVINNLLSQFDKKINKIDVTLTTYSFGGSDEVWWLKHQNINIFKYPKSRYFRTFMYIITLPFLIPYLLIIKKPDFLISTNPIMWFIAKKASSLFRLDTKIIAWYHYSYELKPVRKILLMNSDEYFTISSAAKEELTQKNVNPDKIHIVYNPVIPSNKTIYHSKNNNVFVYVGRTEYGNQKNISELFKALSKLDNKDWKLLNYGVGPDRYKLEQLSKSLNIDQNIHWMGFKENVFDHIDEADALVLTSKFEGFSMVIAEAISHGLFSISSDCPSGPNELINNDNGILYKVGEVESLSKYLNNVLNSEFCIDHEKIKKSISRLYIDNYFKRFIKSINDLYK